MKTNHYYKVSAMINGTVYNFRRHFTSRPKADSFVCKLIYKNDLQVENIRRVEKHVEEDYCDSRNKFLVARV